MAEAEAEALHAAAVEKWQEAARVAQLGKLTDARGSAQAALDEHKRGQQVLEALLADAEAAEDAAATELEPQARARSEIEREVELAVSMKHGIRAVNRARERLRDVGADLKPYQDALEKAARRRRQAEQKVAASVARADQLGRALTDAESELARPPPAPMSPRAVQASPFLLLIRGTLDHDPAALEMARETGRAICDQTGATSEIIAEARAEVLAEQDSEFRRTPLMVGRGPGGQRAARPNPYHAGNPQPYHRQRRSRMAGSLHRRPRRAQGRPVSRMKSSVRGPGTGRLTARLSRRNVTGGPAADAGPTVIL